MMNYRKAKALTCVSLCLALVLSLAGCKKDEGANTNAGQEAAVTEEQNPQAAKEPGASDDAAKDEAGDPNALEPGMMRSFLSGLPVDEKIGMRRPVAIMLNNLEAAQPMSGNSYADVIYEYVVEGGITRFMGIFENYDNLDKIGSVRSCREYFVYTALEFDAVYMHFGQANYALNILGADYVDNLNGLDGSFGDICFYRTTDRKAPHNVYTSAKGIEAGIKEKGYRENHNPDYSGKFKFCDLDKTVTNENGIDATHIEPNYKLNKPWFEYNAQTQKYERYQYGEPQVDGLTGETLAFDNVIFQYAFWTQLDDKDYLAFDCHSGGVIQYFTHGKCVFGKWQRDINEENADLSAVRYYDMEGNELEINNGKTFICVIQNTEAENVVVR